MLYDASSKMPEKREFESFLLSVALDLNIGTPTLNYCGLQHDQTGSQEKQNRKIEGSGYSLTLYTTSSGSLPWVSVK